MVHDGKGKIRLRIEQAIVVTLCGVRWMVFSIAMMLLPSRCKLLVVQETIPTPPRYRSAATDASIHDCLSVISLLLASHALNSPLSRRPSPRLRALKQDLNVIISSLECIPCDGDGRGFSMPPTFRGVSGGVMNTLTTEQIAIVSAPMNEDTVICVNAFAGTTEYSHSVSCKHQV